MKKFIIIMLLIFCIVLYSIPAISYAEDLEEMQEIQNILEETKAVFSNSLDEPTIYCKAAVVIDRETGTVLYEKNMNEKRAQASTTKVMTEIIAIERGNLDDVVTVSSKAANTSGSSLELPEGAKITMRDLIYGLMFISGNDCAVAIAEHIAGSVEEFAVLMNEKAKEIRMY